MGYVHSRDMKFKNVCKAKCILSLLPILSPPVGGVDWLVFGWWLPIPPGKVTLHLSNQEAKVWSRAKFHEKWQFKQKKCKLKNNCFTSGSSLLVFPSGKHCWDVPERKQHHRAWSGRWCQRCFYDSGSPYATYQFNFQKKKSSKHKKCKLCLKPIFK